MFGTYRYLLAFMVVISHLWPDPGRASGGYAVFGFYMLSGYLMTMVLTTTYGFTPKGLGRFLANRALRIYPPYLTVLLFALVMAVIDQGITHDVNIYYVIPGGLSDWLRNIFIFGLTKKTGAAVIPPTWSLYVELSFYVMMALVFVRRRELVIVWFVLSLGYTIYMVTGGYSWHVRYYEIKSASLPFSAGALLYYHRGYLKGLSGWHLPVAASLFVINGFMPSLFWDDIRMTGFYVSLMLNLYLLATLCSLDKRGVPGFIYRLDRVLGDLSYPIFLCHYSVAAYVVWLFYSGAKPSGEALFVASLPLINIVGLGVYVLVDSHVNRIRDRIRHKKAA